MPPKKKVAKTSSPALEGCVIALSGTFPGHTHGDLGTAIKDAGGKHVASITKACTHLCTSNKDFVDKSAKVTAAEKDSNISMVSIDWLLDSISKDARADEASYSPGFVSSSTTATTQAAAPAVDDNTKKRGRSAKADSSGKDSVKAEDEEDIENGETKDEENGPPAKKFKDTQKATSKNTAVPLDETCYLTGHRVYIDDEGTIWDAALNQTNAGANNNKFYRLQILQGGPNDFKCWTRWGRVGEKGQSMLIDTGTFHVCRWSFKEKFRAKTGHQWENRLDPPKKGKYYFIERTYESDHEDDEEVPDASSSRDSKELIKQEPSESKLEVKIQDLMKLIFNQGFFAATMADMNYDANKLPLGKLSKRTITNGMQALKDLAEVFADSNIAQSKHNTSATTAIEDLSNSYYTIIPHAFGRNRPPIISNEEMLKKEIELLDSLSEMSIASNIMKEADVNVEEQVHPIDKQYAGIGMKEMTALEHSSDEFKHLEEYLVKTHGKTHYMKMKVEEIFRIERSGEEDRFIKSEYSKAPKANRRLLWHGSRCTNFGGILSQGLRIAPPEAPVSGYMFGKGVYLADISSKSANYCYHNLSDNTALLLLCDSELGDPMLELTNANSDAANLAKSSGKYATWGKGMTVPSGWKDASCVDERLAGVLMPATDKPPCASNVPGAYLQYNEYIAYNVAQIRLRYLFRVKIN